MIWLAVAVLIAGLTALAFQRQEIAFRREQLHWKDNERLSDELESRLAEFDQLKSEVETLRLKVGLSTRLIK